MTKLRVLFVSAEVTPLAKVGGLADVVGALPKALAGHGVDVRIIMPLYGAIDRSAYRLQQVAGNISVPLGAKAEVVNLWQTTLPDSAVPVYLIDAPRYFGQRSIYFEKEVFVDGLSEVYRFAFFTKAVLASAETLNWTPAIIHCHDWHTGLLPALKDIAANQNHRWREAKTLYTLHNLGMTGPWSAGELLNFLGLDKADHPNFSRIDEKGDLHLLEQGIVGADMVNTVSPTYAEEILTPEFGGGLESTLQKRAAEGKLVGILNGIDTMRFNPETDPALAENFTTGEIEKKLVSKKAVQLWAGFNVEPKTPLVAFIGRLFEQKGFDLIPPAVSALLRERSLQLVVLGTGAEQYEQAARQLAGQHAAKVKAEIAFNAELAQRLYAGADLFLMPSRYEPCGLGQMIAMRYGTVPVVTATGGLKDTVIDADQLNGTGFVFPQPAVAALTQALRRAMTLFDQASPWRNLVRRGMAADFSWDRSSRRYLKLYQSLVQ